jgi:hypothetical protein
MHMQPGAGPSGTAAAALWDPRLPAPHGAHHRRVLKLWCSLASGTLSLRSKHVVCLLCPDGWAFMAT